MRRISLQTLMSKRTRTWRLLLLCSVLLFSYLVTFYSSFSKEDSEGEELALTALHERRLGRRLLEDSNRTNANYPRDAFTLQQRRRGAVVLHVAGMAYMFVALAVVCDEFFVPSLNVITERLHVPEDVSGATFMAAGGSAPELFTSVIGVFIAQSDVGIGTIVGSAVFNILFVIGMCAMFSREALHLTWWPLFRDVSFYSTSLVLLIAFFFDGFIYWWEALILFLFYAGYVFFMKYDRVMEAKVKGYLCRPGMTSRVQDTTQQPHARRERQPSLPILHSGSGRYRHGILQLMIHTIDPLLQDKVHEKAAELQTMASLRKVSNHSNCDRQHSGASVVDKDNSVSVQEVSNGRMSHAASSAATCNNTINNTLSPEKRFHTSETTTANLGNGSESKLTEGGAVSALPPSAPHPDDSISSSDTRTESHTEEEEPLDLSWPKTWQKQVTYVLLAPIIFLLWITLADVRRPEKRKWFALTFVGSVLWIAAYSYLMVWWANETGQTIGIPDEVMGLTILAAGTSIPDLITSVIVAKKGFGDMAVSSSVGSNIFDITVGLPVPWILYGAVSSGSPYQVNSSGLLCSIILLFIMLLAVIIVIAVCRWRMSKLMGVLMLVLYVLFVIVSVLLEFGIISCPA